MPHPEVPLKLSKLPRIGHWEIALHRRPGGDQGILLVMDAATRAARALVFVDVHQDFADALATAAAKPEEGRPCRPKAIRCCEPLRAQLAAGAKALGASLQVVEALPYLDALLAAAFSDRASDDPIPADPDAWRPLVPELVTRAPWEYLSERVEFRFHGGPSSLDDAVAVFLGGPERSELAVFLSERAYAAFLARDRDPRAAESWQHWVIGVEHVEDLDEAYVERADALGLVHEEQAVVLSACGASWEGSLDQRNQESARIAVQGVLGACARHAHWLVEKPTLTAVATDAGDLWVSSFDAGFPPPGLPPLVRAPLLATSTLVDFDDVVRDVLILQLADGPAEQAWAALKGVDVIGLELRPGREIALVAWAGAAPVAEVCRLPDARNWWALVGEGVIGVAGGGPRPRASSSPKHQRPIRYFAGYSPTDAHAAVVAAPGLTGAVAALPPAWDVLRAFADPLGLDQLSGAEFDLTVRLAASVWSAVVLADALGRHETLERILANDASTPDWMLARLVERKRTEFGDLAWKLEVVRIDPGASPTVHARWCAV